MTARRSTTDLLFIVTVMCTSLRAGDHRFVVFEAGKHGYIDEQGSLVIPVKIEGTYVLRFSEGRAQFPEPVKPIPSRLPYVDGNGKVRIFPQEKWGFIDTQGVAVIQPTFDAAQDFSEGLAGVGFDTDQTDHACLHCDANRRWGFIDKEGNTVVQPRYRSVRPFSEGLAAVRNDAGKWGYVDAAGHLIIPFQFRMARDFHGGLAAVAVQEQIGFIDKGGDFRIKPRFALAEDFSGGLAAVRVGGKTASIVIGRPGGRWLFVGTDGAVRIRLPRNTDQARSFSEGRAPVSLSNGHCEYIDSSGGVAIPPRFSYCGDFSEGLANVLMFQKWHYVDRDGKVAFQAPYGGVRSFQNGLAWVEDAPSGPSQRFGYIDKRGTEVWKLRPAM